MELVLSGPIIDGWMLSAMSWYHRPILRYLENTALRYLENSPEDIRR
jgi:hypothetical protein